jgi:hypothetical protein
MSDRDQTESVITIHRNPQEGVCRTPGPRLGEKAVAALADAGAGIVNFEVVVGVHQGDLRRIGE